MPAEVDVRSSKIVCSAAGGLVFIFGASPVSAAAKFDADSLGEAASMVTTQDGLIERFRKYCAQELPANKRNFDIAALNWRSRNSKELDAAASFYDAPVNRKLVGSTGTATDAGFAGLKLLAKAKGTEGVCGGLAAQWQSGEVDVAKDTPRASQFLRDYLLAHPRSREQQDRKDHTVGCLKQSVNKGNDFDASLPVCECITRETFAGLTAEERAEVDRRAVAHQSIADYPPIKRVLPRLAACAQTLPAR
jgi:hypothetical protein